MVRKNNGLRVLTVFLAILIMFSLCNIGIKSANATTSADLSISQNGIDFIKGCEGFSEYCYYDGAQSSIGYGTKCGTTAHSSKQHKITREQAEIDMLREINNQYIPNIRKQTSGIQMNQSQFDALVSFTYNTGGGNTMIKNSPLVKFLRGELSESDARSQFENYVVTNSATGKVDQGLKNRRNKEANLFFSSNPIPDPPILSINQNTGIPNDIIRISWNKIKYAESYWLHIYKDGKDYINQTLNQELSYSAKYPAGNYTVYVASCNSQGEALSSVDFTIYDSNPETPYPQISKKLYSADEIVEVTWNDTSNTTHYWLHTYKDGEEFENADMYNNLSYSRTYPAGEYTLFIASYNNYGESHNYVEFTVYDSIPKSPELKIEKKEYSSDEMISVSWNNTANTTHYWLHTYKDGEEFENADMYNDLSYSRRYPVGKYTLFIASYNNYGESHNYVEFTVYNNGDCNDDGEFNISDAVLLQKWLLSEPYAELSNWKAADLCEDDKLDIFDMIEMRKLLIQNNSLSAQ